MIYFIAGPLAPITRANTCQWTVSSQMSSFIKLTVTITHATLECLFLKLHSAEVLSLFEQRLMLRSRQIPRYVVYQRLLFLTYKPHLWLVWTWCYCVTNIWETQMTVIYFLHGQESLILSQTCLKNNFIVQYCIVLHIEYCWPNVLFDRFKLYSII